MILVDGYRLAEFPCQLEQIDPFYPTLRVILTMHFGYASLSLATGGAPV